MNLNLRQILPALLLLAASGARAEDVTFNVPVDVKSLEAPIKMVAVYCRVFDANRQQVAAAYSPFVAVDAGGNYNGKLAVKLTGVTADHAANYRCSLTLARADQSVYSNDLIYYPATDAYGKP